MYYLDDVQNVYNQFQNQPDQGESPVGKFSFDKSRHLGYSVAISNENNVIGMGSPKNTFGFTSLSGSVVVVQGTIKNISASIPVLDFSHIGDKYINIENLSGIILTLSFINANNVGQTGYIFIYIDTNINDGGEVGFGSINFDSGFVVNGYNDWTEEKYSFYKYFIVEEGVVLTKFDAKKIVLV